MRLKSKKLRVRRVWIELVEYYNEENFGGADNA